MPQPTELPRWADVGGDIVEPNSAKKDVGWVSAERPPAQYFNWILNLIYQWIEWLRSENHDTKVLNVHPSIGGPRSATDTWGANAAGVNFTNAAWLVPLPLRAGDRLLAVSAYVEDEGSGIEMVVRKNDGIGGITELGTDVTPGTGTDVLTVASLTETIADAETITAEFRDELSNGNLTNGAVYSILVVYDRP